MSSGGGQGGTNEQNGFDFSSKGDPHVATTLNGKNTYQMDNNSEGNFNTVQNTVGGPTQLSTTTEPGPNNSTYNKTATLQSGNGGPGSWSLQTSNSGGSVSASVKGPNGTQQLQNGQSIQENGATISMNNGQVTVQQQTTSGGSVTTTINPNGDGSGKGLNIEQQGTGDCQISGSALQQAQTAPSGTADCSNTTNQAQAAGVSSGSGGGQSSGGGLGGLLGGL
jgi:hypothetical protein